jgi:hypothetical protein
VELTIGQNILNGINLEMLSDEKDVRSDELLPRFSLVLGSLRKTL